MAKLVKDTDGAIGYVDFSDANASELTFASIKNSAGKFIMPIARLRRRRRAGCDGQRRPHLRPDQRRRVPAAYPITSPTWIIVYTDQTDAAKGNAIKAFLNYIYGDGQKLARSVDYAPLPKALC